MHRSTSGVRRACAVGTTIALIGLTTGLGVFAASSASAAEPVTATAPADAGTTDVTTDPTTGTTGTDTAGTSTTDAGTGTTGTDTTGNGTSSGPGTGTTDGSATPTSTPTPTATSTPKATAPTTTSKAASSSAAAIVGEAKVGETLRVDAPELSGSYTYAWSTDDGVTVASDKSSYPVTSADLGKRISVVVTDSAGDIATATTADAVTEDVAFADTTTADAPRTIEVTAGDTVDETFTVAKGSGDVTYALGYTDPDSVDPDNDTPDSYLPFEATFDPATATLSGTLISAGTYDFTVVASNGTSKATEYVEVTVDPAAAVGILASATDRSNEDSFDGVHPTNAWIIEPDGHIVTISFPADLDQEPTFTDGGQPTVKQGASLWVNGSPVDQYGNDTTQYDDEGNAPQPTVTSSYATDQIAFDEDSFATKVTFPHASTHVLTVAEDALSVSFPVTVVPTVAPVAAVTPTTPKGQLAFTGSDTTDALPWGIAMLAAGAGLIGFRTFRRRTQR
ncbi:hypothetical protein ACLBWP_04265 [Microbacterium sp. M1A1_1b]